MPVIDKFLSDPRFCSWVLGDKAENSFWENYIAENPNEKETIHRASQIVKQVTVVEPELGQNVVDRIWGNIDAHINSGQQQSTQPVQRFIWTKGYTGAVAAAVVVLIVASWFAYSNMMTITVTAGFGNQVAHTLPDGSKVRLNAGSELTYNKSSWDDERTLSMKGEVFFEVKKGSVFSVQTDFGTVSVLGTSFNVFSRENNFNVACYSGKVKVVTASSGEKLLSKGEQVRLSNGKLEHSLIESGNSDVQPSWLSGISHYNNLPLKKVFAELERQFDVKVAYAEGFNIDRHYTGSMTSKSLKTSLELITKTMKLDYEIQGKVVTIKEAKSQ